MVLKCQIAFCKTKKFITFSSPYTIFVVNIINIQRIYSNDADMCKHFPKRCYCISNIYSATLYCLFAETAFRMITLFQH